MTRRKKRFLGIGGLLLIVIVIVGLNFSGSTDKETSVQADLAIRDNISEIVTASGRIQPQTKVDITSEVSAQIIELYVKEGDEVSKGHSLVLLDTVQTQADVATNRYVLDEIQARAQATKTEYEKAKLEFERQEKLHAQGLTSENSFTDARFALDAAEANNRATEAQVRTQRARLDKALDNLSKTLITAPMDGIITFMNAEVGEIAQAQTSFTQGRTLMTISDLGTFEVEVDVDETEVTKVHLGQPVEIRPDAYRDTTFAGTVVEIGNSATVVGEGTENYTTSFRVKVRLDDKNIAVRPGMSASVDITTAESTDALQIPYSSVVTREFDPDSVEVMNARADAGEDNSLVASVQAAEADGEEISDTAVSRHKKKKRVKMSGVFVVQNGIVLFREVETGIADERNVEIRSGLIDGDTVVSGTFRTLRTLNIGDAVTLDESSVTRMNEQSSE